MIMYGSHQKKEDIFCIFEHVEFNVPDVGNNGLKTMLETLNSRIVSISSIPGHGRIPKTFWKSVNFF